MISPQKSNFWFSISGILILISVVLTLITFFGKNPLIQYFSFYKVDFKNNFINFYSLQDTFFSFYEFWRLISPIFIHFSITHLIFNCLWIYILGPRIINQNGIKNFLLLTFSSAILSNASEAYVSGLIIFGGLSGVIFAMLGYCYAMEFIKNKSRYLLPPAIYIFMIGWLLIGYLGILESFGFGKIANTAHLIGLISGILFAFVND